MAMELPPNTELPFFAYGIFRPGQLGFFRIKHYVQSVEPAIVQGELRIRDGLPIADPDGRGKIPGTILFFEPKSFAEAYKSITKLEPGSQYIWGQTSAEGKNVNILWGKSPLKGSYLLEEEWDGKQDPLFRTALKVVEETLKENETFEWDLKPLFRLQMAYLLLWSAIERYVSLRYNLGEKKATKKVEHLAEESAFAEGLRRHVSDPRVVFSAGKPTEKKYFLDANEPKESLYYYYQIRNNITHRGKGAVEDFQRLKMSSKELLAIFREVLQQAFRDSKEV